MALYKKDLKEYCGIRIRGGLKKKLIERHESIQKWVDSITANFWECPLCGHLCELRYEIEEHLRHYHRTELEDDDDNNH